MDKRYWIASVAVFLVSFVFSFIVHGLLLHADYLQVANLMRSDAEARGYVPFMILAHVIKGFAFVWIYRWGISADKPWWGQGIRFGLAAALLTVIPLYLLYYSVQPMPGMLIVKQLVVDSIGTILLGIVAAAILTPSQMKGKAQAASRIE
jgi:hypothetical protein